MVLKANLRQFLDENGNVLTLTEQVKTVFNFLTHIVSSVSENIVQPLIKVDLKCSARGNDLACEGGIEARVSPLT